MIQTIDSYEFIQQIMQVRPDNFTREALELIFDYLENTEEETGEQVEFYPLDVCLMYAESSIESIIRDYSIDVGSFEDQASDDLEYMQEDYIEYLKAEVMEYLERKTYIVGETSSGCIVFNSEF